MLRGKNRLVKTNLGTFNNFMSALVERHYKLHRNYRPAKSYDSVVCLTIF